VTWRHPLARQYYLGAPQLCLDRIPPHSNADKQREQQKWPELRDQISHVLKSPWLDAR
jgi:hypothetical protein